jgi:hypothetical protein
MPSRERLLILSCGSRKAETPAPALILYDGPVFRQVRAFLARTLPAIHPRIMILSAEHGLVAQDQRLGPYDRLMDAARADELAAAVPELPPAGEVFVFGGRLYRQVVEAWASAGAFGAAAVLYASGRGNGDMMSQLGRWLEEGGNVLA